MRGLITIAKVLVFVVGVPFAVILEMFSDPEKDGSRFPVPGSPLSCSTLNPEPCLPRHPDRHSFSGNGSSKSEEGEP